MDKSVEYASQAVPAIVARIGELAAGSQKNAEQYIWTELVKAYRAGATDAHRRETPEQEKPS